MHKFLVTPRPPSKAVVDAAHARDIVLLAEVEGLSGHGRSISVRLPEGSKDAATAGVGLRLAMYRVFWERWRQRPIFGWGPGKMTQALDDSGVNALSRDRFVHFHSSYFSVLFGFGIVGGAFGHLAGPRQWRS